MSIKKNKLRDRFNKKSSESFININSSLENDKFLFEEDIEASIAHATMPVSYTHLTLPTKA